MRYCLSSRLTDGRADSVMVLFFVEHHLCHRIDDDEMSDIIFYLRDFRLSWEELLERRGEERDESRNFRRFRDVQSMIRRFRCVQMIDRNLIGLSCWGRNSRSILFFLRYREESITISTVFCLSWIFRLRFVITSLRSRWQNFYYFVFVATYSLWLVACHPRIQKSLIHHEWMRISFGLTHEVRSEDADLTIEMWLTCKMGIGIIHQLSREDSEIDTLVGELFDKWYYLLKSCLTILSQ